MVRLRFLFLLTMAAVASQSLQGFDDVFLKRGEPQREGRAWVEHAECGGGSRGRAADPSMASVSLRSSVLRTQAKL